MEELIENVNKLTQVIVDFVEATQGLREATKEPIYTDVIYDTDNPDTLRLDCELFWWQRDVECVALLTCDVFELKPSVLFRSWVFESEFHHEPAVFNDKSDAIRWAQDVIKKQGNRFQKGE